MSLDATFAGTRIVIDRDDHGPFVCTTLPDGARVMARPIDEPWEHTRLHDLLHVIIGEADQGCSPALWNAAHSDDHQFRAHDLAAEEARVLAAQAAILAALLVER